MKTLEAQIVEEFKKAQEAERRAAKEVHDFFYPRAQAASDVGDLDALDDLAKRCPADSVTAVFIWDMRRQLKIRLEMKAAALNLPDIDALRTRK